MKSRRLVLGIYELYRLSPQESKVLDLLIYGTKASSQEIAGELDISVNTVGIHLKNIYAKFGVKSKSQVLQKVLRNFL